MQPPHTAETQGEDVTSWVSVCPRGLWEVRCRRTREAGQVLARRDHIGEDKKWSPVPDCPRVGALCWVRVRLKENPQIGTSTNDQGDKELSITSDMPTPELTEAQAMPFPRSQDSVLQVPLGDWIVLRLGEGQCDVTEGCVEQMRAGERCEVQLTPLRDGPKGQPSEASMPQLGAGQKGREGERIPDQHLYVTIELHSFTRSRESWEMPIEEKWHWIGSHKERGGDRFRSGDVWGAADSYSRALKLLITLHGQVRGEEEREGETKGQKEERDKETSDKAQEPPTEKEYQTIKAELHSNLSLCQLKLHQPERARASAAKATQLEPSGTKAWYRLGQACLEVAELGEARRAFRRLLELQPDSPSAQRGLKEVGSRERETDHQLGQRLSKMFS